MPLADGVTFAGFTIVRLLGSGGMGEVYLARHPRLPRQDALKVLPTSVSADDEFRERFNREADLAATLWHPHIVGVHDRGEFEDRLWISMDYVEGTDAARLSREQYPEGMPVADVVAIVSAVAEALDYAHEQRLLHRDVKPANILLTDPRNGERRILLADFGIARHADDVTGLTATNMTIGSVSYTAPEQLMGEDLDGRADQYALAATAFHLLTGAPPYPHTNPTVVISRHLNTPAPTVSATKPQLAELDDVLAKALAKQPGDRYDNCQAFARAFADASTAEAAPVIASPGSTGASEPTVHHQVPLTIKSNWGYTEERPDPSAAKPAQPLESARRVETIHSEPAVFSISGRTALLIGGTAALLAVGVVAFVGARLAQPSSAPSTASSPQPSPAWEETQTAKPPETVTYTAPPVTATRPGAPPTVVTPPPPTAQPSGDLNLPTRISVPQCNGQGIVVLGNVTTPGLYATGVQALLNAHPGASYLRTDHSCPSLRQVSGEGNPIYAVFELGGRTQPEVCAAVNAVGGDAYGKWLDHTTDPTYIIKC
jgi:serine/threonine protein kinase, bacterial